MVMQTEMARRTCLRESIALQDEDAGVGEESDHFVTELRAARCHAPTHATI